jgi:hypothetical protein
MVLKLFYYAKSSIFGNMCNKENIVTSTSAANLLAMTTVTTTSITTPFGV